VARDRLADDRAALHYAAIVESSDDAILSKDLNGVITSWNLGAQRLFGYTAEEAVGKSVTILIPLNRYNEEPMILDRIRRGERIDHYETVRQRKDGSLLDISLTVSPIRDLQGRVIGASKIARDISDRKRAEERQELLLSEMNHRVKNLFALAISVLSLSGRSATGVQQLVETVRERLAALSRAHALTLAHGPKDAQEAIKPATLRSLIEAMLAPYEEPADAGSRRFAIRGHDLEISGAAISSLALLLHELATNSAKYGALSTPRGRIEIDCQIREETLSLTWSERDGPTVSTPVVGEGFGGFLMRAAVGQLGSEIAQDWKSEGLVTGLSLPCSRLKA
jgi:PAS domain S-box-containing protein